jgi:hypothetical protein
VKITKVKLIAICVDVLNVETVITVGVIPVIQDGMKTEKLLKLINVVMIM